MNQTCVRCRKEIEGTFVEKIIFFQDRRDVWKRVKGKLVRASEKFVNQKQMTFCSDICAQNEQMSREG